MLSFKNVDPGVEPLRALGNVIADPDDGSGVEAVSRPVDRTGKGSYVVDNVLGDVRFKQNGPQVFLVHQGPHGATPPHYHEVDQFQIFVRGAGKIGRESLGKTVLHYADAYTTYGPIVSYDDGVDYFTVRLAADCGTHYMPESRKEKPRKSGRHFTVALNEREAARSKEPVVLIERQSDGLAACLIHLEAGAPLELPSLTGKGRLVAVVTGSILDGQGVEHQDWSWGGLSVSDTMTDCVAGSAGASVLCLDYPYDTGALN